AGASLGSVRPVEVRCRPVRGPVPSVARGVLLRSATLVVGIAICIVGVLALETLVSWGVPSGLLLLLCLLAWIAMSVATIAMNRMTVAAGDDGLFVYRRLRRRFLPYARITGMVRSGTQVIVSLREEDPLLFKLAEEPDATLFLERVAHGRTLAARPRRPVEKELTRGDRPVAAWLGEMRDLTRRDGYRESGVTVDDLWTSIEDPSLGLPERVAATIALREHL